LEADLSADGLFKDPVHRPQHRVPRGQETIYDPSDLAWHVFYLTFLSAGERENFSFLAKTLTRHA
jgi:hypothetical protein